MNPAFWSNFHCVTLGLMIVTVFAHMYGIHGTMSFVSTLSIPAKQFVRALPSGSFEQRSLSLSMLGMPFVVPLTPRLFTCDGFRPTSA